MGCFVVDGAPNGRTVSLSPEIGTWTSYGLGRVGLAFIDDVGLHVKLCGHREKDRAHALAQVGHCERAAMFGMTPQTA